ncbi:bifunctional glutamate N-acetyltransferase/amino-acid acetyltransferase ArgJ [Desulforamulus hydrothermalis]|uniref:Arginine biosynthesis bifunctional protein ArgJ n=1 Tax=Desulforamulus hydrothermalis Lam5 = DSM 18033 TaxID=1121428 RepID=K8DYJ1_9FIRM|nr:bifunctional glutamate N-acetyltransferase/amino-acid acetyltransferase ArgJ [Desulforamulus hydrothermalis]CCO07840.1 Arginine biosynthesis bifunctional protein ArgJ (Includes: Glutamate N-acetyltransferase; Amino-acid acetyltransferase) [Desulforamulus hydrothermalis Lam5 = DSM 18033]SHH27446.1 glutamate N-acetyltransferase [Desulforamulus hydrothermalis Lam5 = DSM 18033]
MINAGAYQPVPGGVTAARGFLAGGAAAGLKKNGQLDLALIYSSTPARAAGVYTTNLVQAAPLVLTRRRVAAGTARAVIINAGNANACTGARGLSDAAAMAGAAAAALDIEEQQVLVASTGVIGVPLPVEKIAAAVPALAASLSPENHSRAARAIMTTDLVAKEYAVQVALANRTITIGGMAKGSGMIHPNMATMLCFITTDANIGSQALQAALKQAVDDSFNMITVDGDTSTNDMVLALANGQAANPEIMPDTDDFRLFYGGLLEVCSCLAKMIARDGEGATRLIEVTVTGAPTVQDARLAARAVAGSNLFKAAVFGQDANWGRILCAVGYSGANFRPDRVDIYIGDVQVAGNGGALDFAEERAAAMLKQDPVTVRVDLKCGAHRATAWGCDLTYDYVRINGSYRT